jgi:hypothetical protein
MPSASSESAEEALSAIGTILSIETLTILQLVGFNFRKAIGEPLTDLVAALISSRAAPPSSVSADLQRLAAERELAYIELAKDEAAYGRLQALFPGSGDVAGA